MARSTRTDVLAAFRRFCDVTEHVLPAGEYWHLQEGSPSAGYAWRLFVCNKDGGGRHSHPLVSDYLGWSCAEAEASLWALVRGFQLCQGSHT